MGFESTTSRVTGEVTLPFHRVQLRLPFGKFCDAILCVDNFKPGGINEHSYGADDPVIVVIEVSLLCTIPVSSAAEIRPECFAICSAVELQELSPLAGFEPASGGPM